MCTQNNNKQVNIQAIALSLGGVAENSAVSGVLSQKSGTKESEIGGKRKNRKLVYSSVHIISYIKSPACLIPFYNIIFHCVQFKSRVQLSEDEVIGYFFLFDGNFFSPLKCILI